MTTPIKDQPTRSSPVTADQAVSALSARRMRHPRIKERMADLGALMYPPTPDEIILICGPTGVGKTTLAEFLVEDAVSGSHAAMNRDAGLIPAVGVEAVSSGEDEFSWTLLYHDLLGQLEGDLPMRRKDYGVDPRSNRLSIRPTLNPNSMGALRKAAEGALKERKAKHVVIDEAAHLMQHQSLRRLTKNMNTLKSLSNLSGAQIVLCGSYDLFQMMRISGQLSRRTQVIHFDRYRQDNDADVRAFMGCVQWFEKALPELFLGRLLPYSEALHENTLGCVGTMRDVLSRAARLMAADGGWNPKHLERALLTDAQRDSILQEILAGEEAINPGLTHTKLRKDSVRKVA